MMKRAAIFSIVLSMSVSMMAQTLYNIGGDGRHAAALSPEFPETMRFADTDISFDRVDMYERMDREMISLIYSHTNTMLTIKRANRYYSEILPILKEQGVPADFFYLAAIESCFDNRAVSVARAGGIWQFMPATARQFGLEVNDYVDERYNCEKATKAACKYLKQGYRKYGCWMTVASSYMLDDCGFVVQRRYGAYRYGIGQAAGKQCVRPLPQSGDLAVYIPDACHKADNGESVGLWLLHKTRAVVLPYSLYGKEGGLSCRQLGGLGKKGGNILCPVA